jgi:hypothetical protein
MKSIKLELLFPDNGGVLLHHNPAMAGSKMPTPSGRQKLYMCTTLDPAEVGATLMAMLADMHMTDAYPLPSDLDKEIEAIQF